VKFVSSPPSQRWFEVHPAALRFSATASWAWRFVPTNSTCRRRPPAGFTNDSASPNSRPSAQVDDVDAVALPEDVRLHLGVPALGLMAEVHPGFQQFLDGDPAQWSSCD